MIKIINRQVMLTTLGQWLLADGSNQDRLPAYYLMSFPEGPMDVEIDERETLIIVRNKVPA